MTGMERQECHSKFIEPYMTEKLLTNTPSVPFYKEQFGKNTQTKESYFFIKNSKIL
jgi:hypothetical protein